MYDAVLTSDNEQKKIYETLLLANGEMEIHISELRLMQTAHHTTPAHSAGEGVPKAIMTVRSRFWPVFKTATAVWPLMHLYVQFNLPVDTRVSSEGRERISLCTFRSATRRA